MHPIDEREKCAEERRNAAFRNARVLARSGPALQAALFFWGLSLAAGGSGEAGGAGGARELYCAFAGLFCHEARALAGFQAPLPAITPALACACPCACPCPCLRLPLRLPARFRSRLRFPAPARARSAGAEARGRAQAGGLAPLPAVESGHYRRRPGESWVTNDAVLEVRDGVMSEEALED